MNLTIQKNLFASLALLASSALAQITELPSVQGETSPLTQSARDSKAIAAAPLTMEQIRANLPPSAADRFEFLRNQRKTTLDAISNTTSQLTAIEAKVTSLQLAESADQSRNSGMPTERVKADLVRAKEQQVEAEKRLEAAKTAKKSQAELSRLENDLESRRSFVQTVQGVLSDNEAREKARTDRSAELAALRVTRDDLSSTLIYYQRLLGSLDDMVNQLFIASDATNSFKLRMSIAFSALVGVVIVGFFGIAWSNDEIKKTIFANEAGIQFITVFSIVIAVILFGIIGVLESKELSALLGGLSGYILGKSRA